MRAYWPWRRCALLSHRRATVSRRGRVALQTTDRGRRLVGLTCAEAAPGYLQPILDGEEIVGHVTAGAWSPHLESGIGYAQLDVAGAWAGRRLTALAADGTARACEIIDLPFYDAEKLIAKGLATDIPYGAPGVGSRALGRRPFREERFGLADGVHVRPKPLSGAEPAIGRASAAFTVLRCGAGVLGGRRSSIGSRGR